MATETQLREGTGSRFMSPGATQTILVPTNGQGGTSATASASECVNASARNPVIIDAIVVNTTSTNPVVVNIRDAANTTTLFNYTFPVSTSGQVATFGPLGVQIHQAWGTTSSGGTHTGLHVLYRYGAS